MENYSLNRRQFLKSSFVTSLAASWQFSSRSMLGETLATHSPATSAMNEKIKEARDVALKILNPSEKELQHGLELHRDALVVEAYGFSPRSAPDGGAIRTLIESEASETEIQDAIEDMRMTRCVSDDFERQEYRDAWEAAGVTCIFQNAGEEGNDIARLLRRLARYTYVTDMMGDIVSKAVVPNDIVAAKKQHKHCLYFSLNGVPLPQAWTSVEEELRYLRVFFQLGVRMMHLTYNRRNMIGDGCGEPSDAGLSDFGRAVVAEMNRLGVIVDVAHSGWRTSLEAAQVSERPVVASHTVCNGVHEHIRGKPDEVIEAIVDTDGLIGICCIPRFLGGSGDIHAMLNHIDYAAKKFGVDHVAIGTDLAYTSRRTNEEFEKIPKRRKVRDRWEHLWPEDDFVEKPHMRQSMAWTNWPLFTVGLVQRGYSDDDIRKIIGSNVLRVAREALS